MCQCGKGEREIKCYKILSIRILVNIYNANIDDSSSKKAHPQ